MFDPGFVNWIWLTLAVVFFLLSVASLWWTTRRSRRILEKALNRSLRTEEEASLSTWMRADEAAIRAAQQELPRDPFGRLHDRLRDIFGGGDR
jgi:hypothetical protein